MLLYSNVLYTNKSPHDRLLKEFKTDWMNWRRNQFLRATREHQFWFLFSLQRGFLMGRISYGNGGSLQFTEAVSFWLHCSSSFDSRLFREEAKAYRVVFGWGRGAGDGDKYYHCTWSTIIILLVVKQIDTNIIATDWQIEPIALHYHSTNIKYENILIGYENILIGYETISK